MITEGSVWYLLAWTFMTFALGALVMWVVAEFELRKVRRRLVSAQFQADRALHWQKLAEIETDRAATLKTEVRSLRSKKEAADAENQRLRRRWDNGVLFAATKVVDDRFLERAVDYEGALAEIARDLQGQISGQVTSHVVVDRSDHTDIGVRFVARVMAKPYMWPNEEVDHG